MRRSSPGGRCLDSAQALWASDTPCSPSSRIETAAVFYQDVLDFRLSDYTLAPFRAFFFHIQPPSPQSRVHRDWRQRVAHHPDGGAEVTGRCRSGLRSRTGREGPDQCVTLGRHSNDFMTSFYAQSPSPFMVEYGWGGRDIDPATWVAREYTCGPSLWGHDRSWPTPENAWKRARCD